MAFLSDSKSHLSPLVGYAAKNTGLLHNLRFFGNFVHGYDSNGDRVYANDEPKDHLCSIVKILFPSVEGVLDTVSDAPDNFGKNITDSKPITALLALAMHLRKRRDDINTLGAYPSKGTVKSKISAMRRMRDDYADMFPLREHEQLCNHIYSLMTKPKDSLNSLGYPEFLLEQVLIGFAMVRFDGSQEYLSDLPEGFFASESHPIISKIHDFVRDRENEKRPTAFRIFDSSNYYGESRVFDRKNGILLSKTFNDDVETAVRHLCTLLLWDATKKKFRLCANRDINKFYATYAPEDWSVSAKSAWNAIVGDLNVESDRGPRSRPRIAYAHENPVEYHLDGSIKNYARVLMRIFNLETPDLIKKYRKIKASKSKLEHIMVKIFNLISPGEQFHWSCIFTPDSEDSEGRTSSHGTLEVKFTTSAPITFVIEERGEFKITSGVQLPPKKTWKVSSSFGDPGDFGGFGDPGDFGAASPFEEKVYTYSDTDSDSGTDSDSDSEAEDSEADAKAEDSEAKADAKVEDSKAEDSNSDPDTDHECDSIRGASEIDSYEAIDDALEREDPDGEILPDELPSTFQAFHALGFPIQQDSFYARMCLNLQSNNGIISYLSTVLYFGEPDITPSESQTFQNVLSGVWLGR